MKRNTCGECRYCEDVVDRNDPESPDGGLCNWKPVARDNYVRLDQVACREFRPVNEPLPGSISPLWNAQSLGQAAALSQQAFNQQSMSQAFGGIGGLGGFSRPSQVPDGEGLSRFFDWITGIFKRKPAAGDEENPE